MKHQYRLEDYEDIINNSGSMIGLRRVATRIGSGYWLFGKWSQGSLLVLLKLSQFICQAARGTEADIDLLQRDSKSGETFSSVHWPFSMAW